MNRINKIGVELEGGFTQKQYEQARLINLWHGDGSVHVGMDYEGEIVSPALDVKDLCEWIIANYPKKVNHTCGFHIHVSFKSNLDYSRLMSRTFYRHFLDRWEKWGKKNVHKQDHPFWHRWHGKAADGRDHERSYCQRRFYDPDRMACDQGDRYHQLNYCWSKHGTIENRMLPMFEDPSLGVNAVKYYANMIEKWLTLQPKEKGSTVKMVMPQENDHEEDKLEIADDEQYDVKESICV